jgi:glycosyltransferase involved in cell wall biosynthesis
LLQSAKVLHLPNPLDTTIYHPIDKKIAKSLLNIASDTQLILFGAMNSTSDSNKGFIHLRNALDHLTTTNVELAIFGNAPLQSPQVLPFKTHYLGKFSDDLALSILYSAADVMVVPSLQENLSNAIMEALACGTPVVAFEVGGNSDLIDHRHNGYLARPYEHEDLAYGIDWVLSHNDCADLSIHGRDKVLECFESDHVVSQYIALYRTLLPQED